jgi:hypothetical protein
LAYSLRVSVFAGWLADMLSWGGYTDIGEDGE